MPRNSRRLDYMPFYFSDWLTSSQVRAMTFEERGIFLELLCLAAADGDHGIPKDEDELRRVLGISEKKFRKVFPALIRVFTQHPTAANKLHNKRLTEELDAVSRAREGHVENGRKGSEKRWKKNAEAVAGASLATEKNDSQAIATPSPPYSIRETRDERRETRDESAPHARAREASAPVEVNPAVERVAALIESAPRCRNRGSAERRRSLAAIQDLPAVEAMLATATALAQTVPEIAKVLGKLADYPDALDGPGASRIGHLEDLCRQHAPPARPPLLAPDDIARNRRWLGDLDQTPGGDQQ